LSSYLATLTNTHPAKSSATIPKAIDTAMDKEISAGDSGISMAFGPADDNMDIDKPATNGASANGKRKASMTNGKSYKDASESESDDAPLVRELSCSLTSLPTEG
jgi:DNA topoisomerase-1